MALPQHFMDELRRRTSLSQVIGRHVKLTRKGDRFTGLCPFHNEKTPSFHVRDQDGYYHCFGCGVSGDAISFLREKEGLGFMDAVRQLADAAGMDVPQQKPQDPELVEKRNKTLVILDEAARLYQSNLMSSDNPASAYLKKRGLDQSAIETFRLGFAPKGGLVETLARYGHSNAEIIETGLSRISEKNQTQYQMFRHRLMFPITDNRGQVIAFGGRALDDEQQPKYLNSAESQIFQKKHILYGMALARVAVKKGLPLVVAEGYMDVIAIHQSGLAAAVAPLGTALTEDQIKLLWRMDDQPILCFDGDRAGKAAALKALIRSLPLLEPGKTLRLALLPPGTDPDDLIKTQGRDAFSELLANTMSWMDGLWEGVSAEFNLDEPSQRAAFWQEIRRYVREISNGQMRASIGDEVERRIAGMREMVRGHRQKGVISPYSASKRPSPISGARHRLILALMISHPKLMENFYEQMSVLHFHDEKMENLRQTVINILSGHPDIDTDGLRHHLKEYGYTEVTSSALLKGMESRIRFDPASLSLDEASKRLSEVIRLEASKPKSSLVKSPMQRSHSDMTG